MNTKEFLDLLQSELEISENLTVNTNLKDLEEWDSMMAMMLIGVISNEFSVELSGDDISEITTVQSLIDRIGNNLIVE